MRRGKARTEDTERRSRNQRFVLVVVLVLGSATPGEIPKQNRAVNLSAAPLDSIMVSPAHFDHEKLDVYQLELKISHLGYPIFGRHIWPIAGADARTQGATRSRESL